MSSRPQRLGPPALDSAALRANLWLPGWWLLGRVTVVASVFADERVRRLLGHRSGSVLALLGTWDGRWYRTIATDGYLLVPGRQSDPAFFPFYPVCLHLVHDLGITYELAGPLLSNLALLAALVALYALTRDLFDERTARRSAVYAAIFPLGYVFSMTYPESLVLAAIAAAALAARHRHWTAALAAAAVAALARPEGLFVALPIGASMWEIRHSLGRLERGQALGALLAPVAALISYPLYLATILHDPLAWQRAERAWGRHFSALGLLHTLGGLPAALAQDPWLVRDALAAVLYLVLFALAHRAGAQRAWLAAGLAIVVVPLFSGSVVSVGRFGLLAIPVYWGLARLGRRPRPDRAIRAGSLVLLAAAAATIPQIFP